MNPEAPSSDTGHEDTATGEPVNVGIGSAAHARLQRLKEDEYFADMMDGYRFAVGLALAHGGATTDFSERKNMFNVGSLDPDKSLYYAVAALRREDTMPVYKTMERLATWGVDEMDRQAAEGELSFVKILEATRALGDDR
jgi:hypothetical protein